MLPFHSFAMLREAEGMRGLGRALCEFIISFKHDPVLKIASIHKIMDKNRKTGPRNHVWMRIIRIFPVHFVLAHIHRQSFRNHMVFRWFFTFDTLQMRATFRINPPTPIQAMDLRWKHAYLFLLCGCYARLIAFTQCETVQINANIPLISMNFIIHRNIFTYFN